MVCDNCKHINICKYKEIVETATIQVYSDTTKAEDLPIEIRCKEKVTNPELSDMFYNEYIKRQLQQTSQRPNPVMVVSYGCVPKTSIEIENLAELGKLSRDYL